jgi:hypothetical protein
MSESAPITAKLSPLPFIIMKIIAGHTCAIKALTTTSTDSLNYAMLHTSYENTINPTYTGRLLKIYEILHKVSILKLAKLMHIVFLIYKKHKALIMFKTNSNHDLPIYHTINMLHTYLNSVGNYGLVKNEEA